MTAAIEKKEKDAAFYDFYDYRTFWMGRDYEHRADAMALREFLRQANNDRRRIIDVGSGLGRMTPYYAPMYNEVFLLDPSAVQLEKTENAMANEYPNISFVRGIAEHMPFENNWADAIICVRVSHHIPEMAEAINECMRVLAPDGYLILEVANKLHIKARLKALATGKSKDLYSPDPVHLIDENTQNYTPFVNHNPFTIKENLKKAGFEIVAVRSVSNFRHPIFKNILPPFILMPLEHITQTFFSRWWFGPSIYFLARKNDRK